MKKVLFLMIPLMFLVFSCGSGGDSNSAPEVDDDRITKGNDGLIIEEDESTPPEEDESTPPEEDDTTPPEEDESTPPEEDDATPPEEDVSTPFTEKLKIQSEFLTLNPDEIIFPVKVVLAIDMSLSMGASNGDVIVGTDPNFLRMQAAREFVNTYNTNENVSFCIVLWSNNIVGNTNGFTKDTNELDNILAVNANDTTTDYIGTVEHISQVIKSDIESTRQTENGSEKINRTKYITLFLSDGVPNVGMGIQQNYSIWDPIEDLVDFVETNHVGGFSFHTFLLAEGFDPSAEGQQYKTMAIETMEGMSTRGNGLFRELSEVNDLDFVNTVDMRLTTEYVLKSVIAYNYSVIPGVDQLFVDSDTDGSPDYLENEDTIDVCDFDNDGMSDFFERKMSGDNLTLDPGNSSDSVCDPSMIQNGIYYDTDKDGLNDCEEYILGTNRYLPDTDYDGYPDSIEFRMGTKPRHPDILTDSDLDGVEDWREIMGHTNVLNNDPIVRRDFTYHVNSVDLGIPLQATTDTRLYTIDITNISLMDTRGYITPNGSIIRNDGDNLIRVYISQVPKNNLDAMPIFRMAEFVVGTDDSREVKLSDGDFQLLE